YTPYLASTDTGQVLAELKEAAWPAVWSADGKYLAAAGTNNSLQVWQAGGKLQFSLAGHKAQVMSLAWSPDGKRLASTAAKEKRVLIWDVVKGTPDRELGPFLGAAESVKWSTDGRLVTFNVPEVGWHVWDVEKGQLVNEPKQWKVSWFELEPDGRSALVAPSDKDVYRLRDVASGKDGARLPHSQAGPLAHPIWSPDGRLLAVSLYCGIELWRADLGKRLRTLQPPIAAIQVAFSRDSKWVALLTGERLYLFETETGRPCGILMLGSRNNGLTITAEGNYTGNEKVERGIVMVVQKDDGTQELLAPAEFEHKYGWKNHADKVHLLQALPPSK
ncbi:MAG: WD40 repeat domain-containing protein, partial [Gemmataceae bacterium]